MRIFLDNLLISQKYVSLHCVFHSIRFKFNKGWSKALLLFLCLYANYWTYRYRVTLFFGKFAETLIKKIHPDYILII